MPDPGGWKETFKFFIKELEEVYLPQLKEFWDLVLPVSPLGGEPEKDMGEVPQPVPVPSPHIPPAEGFSIFEQMYPVGGEPPTGPPAYDPPEELPGGPRTQTPFPPWNPSLPYGYRAGTPTPLQIDPGPPTPWWQGPEGIPGELDVPWWRQIPPGLFGLDTHIVQAPSDRERKA